MHKLGTRLALTLVVVCAAGITAGAASANTITATPAGSITATSEGKLTFAGRGGIEIAINCSFTLTGTLARTIVNAASSSVGSITAGRAAGCNIGNARELVEARSPWPMTLTEATRLERAPKLAPITIGGFKWSLEGILGQTCLYEGPLPTQLEGEGPAEAVVTRNERITVNSERIVRNSGLCPERGEWRGEFRLTTQTLRL